MSKKSAKSSKSNKSILKSEKTDDTVMPAPEKNILEDVIVMVNTPGYVSKLTDAAQFGGVDGFMTNFNRRRTELANESKSRLNS